MKNHVCQQNEEKNQTVAIRLIRITLFTYVNTFIIILYMCMKNLPVAHIQFVYEQITLARPLIRQTGMSMIFDRSAGHRD